MSEHNDTATPEVWKPIPGYDGHYDASTLGRIRSNGRQAGTRFYPARIMRQSTLESGYLTVNISLRNRPHHRRVHQLILEAHVGPCPDGMECRHGDGDRKNNRLSNLTWGTKVENMADRDRHGRTLRAEASPVAKLTWATVREMRALAKTGVSNPVLARRFGISRYVAWNVVTNRKWVE
jgi:hypothetical protein